MTSTADLIAATRGYTDGAERGLLTLLPINLPADTAQVSVEFGTDPRIPEHSYLSIGLETFYVLGQPTAAGVCTLLRAQDGSTAETHTAGDLVRIGPRFTDHRVVQALNADLQALASRGLFRVRTLSITAEQSRLGYNLASDVVANELIDVRMDSSSTYSHDWSEVREYQVVTSMPTSEFASGVALFLANPVSVGRTLRVRYRAGFGTLETLVDDVTDDAGLPSTAVDIPPMGAAIRLMAGTPIQRANPYRQGDPRRSDEVATRDLLSSTALLRQLYEERISEERTLLAALHGHKLVRHGI